jgi:hypothetical protein
MNGQFRYPNIQGKTDREQLTEVKKFLWQLVDELNFLMQDKQSDPITEEKTCLTPADVRSIAKKEAKEAKETANEAKTIADAANEAAKAAKEDANDLLVTITLSAADWSGTQSPYVQTVSVAEDLSDRHVALLPDKQVLFQLFTNGTALTTENNGETVTVYAIGNKPEFDMTMQAALSKTKI